MVHQMEKTRFRENEIPFDANILGACVAPRRLILVEGLDDDRINPFGTQVRGLQHLKYSNFLVSRNIAQSITVRAVMLTPNRTEWQFGFYKGTALWQGKDDWL